MSGTYTAGGSSEGAQRSLRQAHAQLDTIRAQDADAILEWHASDPDGAIAEREFPHHDAGLRNSRYVFYTSKEP